jgi:hypothetical protein
LDKTNTNTRSVTGESSQNGTTTGTATTESDANRNGNSTLSQDKTTATVVDNKRVGSDTPNGLLSMTDIKNNVYASKAEIEDSENTVTDKSNQENIDSSHETSTQTASNNDHVSSNANSTQDESGEAKENYTLSRKGHIGVQTASELLLKHIELLGKIQTVYTQFFDECEDLFMGIY